MLFAALVFLHNLDLMAAPKISTKDFFSKLSAENMSLVEEFYDEKIIFKDPIGERKGVSELKAYYANLYKNVDSLRFEYEKQKATRSTCCCFAKFCRKDCTLLYFCFQC